MFIYVYLRIISSEELLKLRSVVKKEVRILVEMGEKVARKARVNMVFEISVGSKGI